jgi:hypothetical protein
MLLYRIFPYSKSATPGSPGHPLYLYPYQRDGRFDNPSDYLIWYLACESSGAVGEVFGDLPEWEDAMFDFPAIPGSRRALAIYQVPDGTPFLEMNDANNLLERGLRPTQVVHRNRSDTQNWSLKVFGEVDLRGQRKWHGIRWWSFQRPHWSAVGYWEKAGLTVLKVEDLDVAHPAVIDAASSLCKMII